MKDPGKDRRILFTGNRSVDSKILSHGAFKTAYNEGVVRLKEECTRRRGLFIGRLTTLRLARR